MLDDNARSPASRAKLAAPPATDLRSTLRCCAALELTCCCVRPACSCQSFIAAFTTFCVNGFDVLAQCRPLPVRHPAPSKSRCRAKIGLINALIGLYGVEGLELRTA